MELHDLISDGSLCNRCGSIKLKACSQYNGLIYEALAQLTAADLREQQGLYGWDKQFLEILWILDIK